MAIINKQQYKRLTIVLIIPLLILGFVLANTLVHVSEKIIFCDIDGEPHCWSTLDKKENEGDKQEDSGFVYGGFYITDNTGFFEGALKYGHFLSSTQRFLNVTGDYRYNSQGDINGLADAVKENVNMSLPIAECDFHISKQKNYSATCASNISNYEIFFKFTSPDDEVKFEKIANDATRVLRDLAFEKMFYGIFYGLATVLSPLFFYFFISWLVRFIIYGRGEVEINMASIEPVKPIEFDVPKEKLILKQRMLKVVDISMYVIFFIIGSVLSRILIVSGTEQNVIWIFIPMGIYRTARIKFNILAASIITILGSMGCVFAFLAAISKW